MLLRLPKPLSEEEVQRHIPPIANVPEGTFRPFWSVMIPTYNRSAYLLQALESLLSQDPGPSEMQIEVVDNCSTEGDVDGLVGEIGRGRVGYFRQARNVGAVPNFNTCLERARGRWVHILHDDDMLMPGFYDSYKRIIHANPELVLVAGKMVTIDDRNIWTNIAGPEPAYDGAVIGDFVDRQALRNTVNFPSAVVRRDAVERVGGFCTLLYFSADREFWFRVGRIGAVAGTARPYLLYRRHSESGTAALQPTAIDVRENYLVVSLNLARLNGGRVPRGPMKRWCSARARVAIQVAYQFSAKGMTLARLNQAEWAWRLRPGWRTGVFLLKSWLKHVLKLRRSTGLNPRIP